MSDDSYWEEEQPDRDSYPGIFSILGCLILAALACFVQPLFGFPQLRWIALAAIGIAILLWAIAWLVTVRHASRGWKLGSLGILTGFALLACIASAAVTNMRLQADVSTIAEIDVQPNGVVLIPPHAEDRGPISRLFIRLVRESSDDRQRLQAEYVRTGLDLLSEPAVLERNPAVLSSCESAGQVKRLALEFVERHKKRLADFAKGLDAVTAPDAFKAGIRQGMNENSQQRLALQAKSQAELLDETQAICSVLSRRHWVAQFGHFAFTSQADLAEFNAHVERNQAAAARLRQIQSEEMEKMRESQGKMRDALRI